MTPSSTTHIVPTNAQRSRPLVRCFMARLVLTPEVCAKPLSQGWGFKGGGGARFRPSWLSLSPPIGGEAVSSGFAPLPQWSLTMKKYLIERDIPGVGKMTPTELKGAA